MSDCVVNKQQPDGYVWTTGENHEWSALKSGWLHYHGKQEGISI